MGKVIDLTGQKFGRLTVIERAENKGRNACWLCKCDCGNVTTVRADVIKKGKVNSCGCLKSESSSERIKQKWQDEDFRKMKSEKTKEQWQDEDFKKMQSEKMKQLNEEQWQDEDFRQIQVEKMKEKWQDEDFKKMQSERTGNKNPTWKGGISPISNYLRGLQIVKQWRKDTYIRENSKCQLTGNHVHGGNSDVHHLKAFNTIVQEAHNLHNIKIKPQVKDYTEEELKLLEDYVISWHEDTTNAVVLSEDVHMLFHSLYGKGENTPEQYMEFKERYLAGEFDNPNPTNNKVA